MPSRPTYKKDINQDDFPGEGSRLVYGTSGLGGVWGEIDPIESVDCLLYAFEQGICSVDTSPSYSESETIVGRALAQWKGERPFISTKVGRLKAATAFDAKLDYSKEGMKERVQMYATDFNERILEKAREGIYPIESVKEYTRNYIKAGGKAEFSDYYMARYDHAMIKKNLKERVLFSSHNLVTDGVFGEMQLILCRNVLIYFNKDLQNKVLRLLADSLCPGGFLCLGSKESMKHCDIADEFEEIAPKEKIYRKKVRL